MITCPNCDKENADESVHCGFCGHQLQEGGKKTMFGMVALDADAIKAAALAAKQAASAASAASDSSDPFAKTEMMPSISGTPAPSPSFPSSSPAMTPAPDPFADDFAALEEQFGNDPSLDAPARPAPTPAGSLPGLDRPPGANPNAFNQPGTGPSFGGPQQSPGQQAMTQAPSQAVQKKKSNKGLIIGLAVGAMLFFIACVGGGLVLAFWDRL